MGGGFSRTLKEFQGFVLAMLVCRAPTSFGVTRALESRLCKSPYLRYFTLGTLGAHSQIHLKSARAITLGCSGTRPQGLTLHIYLTLRWWWGTYQASFP